MSEAKREKKAKGNGGVAGQTVRSEEVRQQDVLGRPVELVSSTFKKNENAEVVMKLESWFENFKQSRRYVDFLSGRGVHYIFKMMKKLDSGEIVSFHVEAKTSDASELYATAKVQQLMSFSHQSHTGGETIKQVRDMLLRKGVGENDVAEFYSEYRPDDPIDVIRDDTAIWLRDEFGIAPWYGALNIPYSISIFTANGKTKGVRGRIVSGFSGCTNSQEDLLYNIRLTDIVLSTFAKAWKQDVIKLDLTELRKDPITETPIHWLGFNEIVTPAK